MLNKPDHKDTRTCTKKALIASRNSLGVYYEDSQKKIRKFSAKKVKNGSKIGQNRPIFGLFSNSIKKSGYFFPFKKNTKKFFFIYSPARNLAQIIDIYGDFFMGYPVYQRKLVGFLRNFKEHVLKPKP